jgi:cyclophilin family peptidyl-prolyl cis-trans isomerase
MAEDFDPCLFLDVAPEAKFRLNIINRHASRFLAQGLDFENGKGMAGLQYDFVELAIQSLEESISKTRSMPTALAIAARHRLPHASKRYHRVD